MQNPTPHRVGRRHLLAGMAAAPAALLLPAPVAAAADRAPAARRRGRPPRVAVAGPHRELTDTFATYGNSGQGWTGADSTYSRRLPGGRRVWMFSDTFLGTVNPDGSRPQDSPIVNNTFVVQRRDDLTTHHGGTATDPAAILSPAAEDQWYWLGGSHVGRGTLDIMFLRFQRTGPGMWDWVWQDNLLGRFGLGDLSLVDTHQMPSQAGVQWSSWLERDGGHTYVYGVEDLGDDKHMHVARVRGHDLRAGWEFFDGHGWSPYEGDSARVMSGVANEYSVTRWRGQYLLVTHDTHELFSNRVLAYVGRSPTGPFTDPTLLYETPETGPSGSYGDPNVITYNSHEHPELRRGNRLLVSYNVNSLDFAGVLADVTKYRPRFIEVELEP